MVIYPEQYHVIKNQVDDVKCSNCWPCDFSTATKAGY